MSKVRTLNIPGIPQLSAILPKAFQAWFSKGGKPTSYVGRRVQSNYGPSGTIIEITAWEKPLPDTTRPQRAWVYWDDKKESEVYLNSVHLI